MRAYKVQNEYWSCMLFFHSCKFDMKLNLPIIKTLCCGNLSIKLQIAIWHIKIQHGSFTYHTNILTVGRFFSTESSREFILLGKGSTGGGFFFFCSSGMKSFFHLNIIHLIFSIVNSDELFQMQIN